MNGDWKLTKLGDVLQNVSRPVRLSPENTYRLLGAHWYAKGLYVKDQKSGGEIQAKTLFEVKKGDFVYNRLFAWKGSFAVASKEVDGCFVSNEFPCFTPLDAVDSKFLWLYFSRTTAWSEALGLSSGSTPTSRNRLKEEQFLNMGVRLPPLDEQRRIVARIEELAVKVHEAQQLRVQSSSGTEAFLMKVLTRTFEKLMEHATTIGAAFRVTTGGTPSRHVPQYWGGDVKWVSSGEVAFCKITDTREKITQQGMANSNAKLYPPNTVLLAMIGQGKTRGQCAILNCNATTNQNVAAIHVHETQHNAEFVYWWLFSRYQASRFTETGTAQPALSGERVKQMPIPLPSPGIQAEVVTHLKALNGKIDYLRKLQINTAIELDALPPSILSKAFRGEL